MSCFSDQIKFKFAWRKYQRHVLDELDSHINDDHLHVIAPPGSGKTVLGLEVMLRLGKPTLILAPTLAIRNQWIQRFCDLFLQVVDTPTWISKDIRNPGLLTVVTYQGLHSACNDTKATRLDFEDETDLKIRTKSNFKFLKDIANKLKDIGVETFVLDESHHLKNEWWQTLIRLKNELKPKIVGLTATPPYDVSPLEWKRYIEMNGAVDVEISVPELMAEGDLCPHQDFVYFTSVSSEERQEIIKIRDHINKIYVSLKSNLKLVEIIQLHPIIVEPLDNEYFIFEHIDFYTACLIFLKENNISISDTHNQLLGLISGNKSQRGTGMELLLWDDVSLPLFDEKWLEILLEHVLFEEDSYFDTNFCDNRRILLERLKHAGVVERNTICLTSNPNINKRISSSITKINAISAIVRMEYAQLQNDLRQVILTDYVRKEYLVNDTTNQLALKRMGVMSIFEYLRRDNQQGIKLAVLTGTLVIIPQSAYSCFLDLSTTLSLAAVSFTPLVYDASYLKCSVDDKNRDQMVFLITQLFELGYIEVLIGTKALLGEGWDAPAINSLILASVIGSFVSSNQMRGRAIRTSSVYPNKTSNIWHIACVDPSDNDVGIDVKLIERRFTNFVGLSEVDEAKIQNGISRLGFTVDTITIDKIPMYNSITIDRSKNRANLKERWDKAIPFGTALVEEIKIPYFDYEKHNQFKAVQIQKTVANTVVTLLSTLMLFVEMSTSAFKKVSYWLAIDFSYAMFALFGIGVLFFGRQAFQAYYLYTRYRDVSKDIHKIGYALIHTLYKNGIFTTAIEKLNVLTFSDKDGYVYCHLEHGTTYENSIFVQLMQEIVEPIYNPRYIIVRRNKLIHIFSQVDYHNVPEILAKKAALASDFLHFWKIYVGRAELMFTRSSKGYQFLIQSRFKALSSRLEERTRVTYVNAWR